MQTLELINERFARQMRHVLLNFMRRSADITVGSIKIQKYADFERNLAAPDGQYVTDVLFTAFVVQ